MAKNDVTTRHPEYDAYIQRWMRVCDVVAGQDAVKARRELYLPNPSGSPRMGADAEQINASTDRYNSYLQRALFVPFVSRTLSALCGIAFAKFPEIILPPEIEALADNVDGSGRGLVNQSQRTLRDVLSTGRAGLLVDFPHVATPLSVAEAQRIGALPQIRRYTAQQVINWDTSIIDGRRQLSFVVIEELGSVRDGFEVQRSVWHRVLRLDNGIYVQQQVHGKSVETFTPTDSGGHPLRKIPFIFVGSEANDETPDVPPMLATADVNIAHYRNSADHEESVFTVGQPMYAAAGVTQQWADDQARSGVSLGSRVLFALPLGASVQILQPQPNTMAREAMAEKERQLIALGSRLIDSSAGALTATQINADARATYSVLSAVADNVSAAYTNALRDAMLFSGGDPDTASFAIPTDFVTSGFDPQALTALIAAFQGGVLPQSELFGNLRRLGIVDTAKTDQELAEEIDAQQPLAPAFGGGL